MQLQDVCLVGHFNSYSINAEIFEDETKWFSFCLNKCGIKKENAPQIDFSNRKVVVVPSHCSTQKRYLVYSETLKDFIKSTLEINFLAFESDCAAQRVLQTALIVLHMPKNEKFNYFINPCPRTIAENDKELVDLINTKEKILDQIRKVEGAQNLIKSFHHSPAPELIKTNTALEAMLKEISWYDKIVNDRVSSLRKTLLGTPLNSKNR